MDSVNFSLSEAEMATITPKDMKHFVKKCVSSAASQRYSNKPHKDKQHRISKIQDAIVLAE